MDPLYKNLKGRFKEAAGALTGHDKLRDEGVAEQGEAEVEDLAGAVTDKATELTDQATQKATGYWNQVKEAFDEGKKEEIFSQVKGLDYQEVCKNLVQIISNQMFIHGYFCCWCWIFSSFRSFYYGLNHR